MSWRAGCGGIVVAALGVAGLVRAAVPLPPAGSAAPGTPPIVVSAAYVRAPAPPTDAAAAYFTLVNTTGAPDRLVSVESGAGAMTMLYTAAMTAASDGAVVPAHGKLILSTGHGHVMIEKLFGTLRAGQTINLNLTFEHAGIVPVAAKVIALGAPVPTGGAS